MQEENNQSRLSRRKILSNIAISGLVTAYTSSIAAAEDQSESDEVTVQIIHEVELPTQEQLVRDYLDENGISEDDVRGRPKEYEGEVSRALEDEISRERSLINIDLLGNNGDSREQQTSETNNRFYYKQFIMNGIAVTKTTRTLRPTYGLLVNEFYDVPSMSLDGQQFSVENEGTIRVPPGQTKQIEISQRRLNLQLQTYGGKKLNESVAVQPSVAIHRGVDNGGD